MTIGQDIANTIINLEHIRDAQNPPSQDVIHQIDDLYNLAVKYGASQIDQTTVQYTTTAQALSTAAQATLNAINDLSQVSDAVGKVASAIKQLTGLIAAA